MQDPNCVSSLHLHHRESQALLGCRVRPQRRCERRLAEAASFGRDEVLASVGGGTLIYLSSSPYRRHFPNESSRCPREG